MFLINPSDTLERQNEKLLTIAHSLMRRVEQKNEQSGLAYQQFERAALLETEVRERTHDLERALDLLQESNARLELLISQSDHISLPKGQSAGDWAARRLSKHTDEHAVFNVRLKFDRWLQVSEHRTSRGGTVILQTDVTTIIRRERRERDKMRDQQAIKVCASLTRIRP